MRTKWVAQFEEISTINNTIKVRVDKLVPGPEEYTVRVCKYAERDMWIVQNWRYSPEGEPIIPPPVFDSLEEAVQCAKALLKEYQKKNSFYCLEIIIENRR